MNVTEKMSNTIQMEKDPTQKSCCFVDLTLKVSMTMSEKLYEENILRELLRNSKNLRAEFLQFHC